MITISGPNTFVHKEQIKALGAHWNGIDRNWQLPNGSDVSSLIKLPGLVITGAGINKPKRPEQPKPINFSQVIENIISSWDLAEETHAPKKGKSEPAVHGNDPTHLNNFSDKNPVMFAGFRSFSDMLDFIEETPEHITNEYRDDRNIGWDHSMAEWKGSNSMAHALRLARNGWTKGTELASEAAEVITGDHAIARKRMHSVAGGRVNVGRMLSGNPLHMVKRPKTEGRKVITLFVQTFMSSGIEPENAIIRAASIAALSDVLAQNGYSCEIVAICTTQDRRQTTPMGHIATVVKEAGEPLNIENIVFALGHPSMFRRFYFGIFAHEERLRSFWPYMGHPAPAFTDPQDLPPGSFYIRALTLSAQNRVRGETFKDRVRSLFPLIVPKGFPVELEKDD